MRWWSNGNTRGLVFLCPRFKPSLERKVILLIGISKVRLRISKRACIEGPKLLRFIIIIKKHKHTVKTKHNKRIRLQVYNTRLPWNQAIKIIRKTWLCFSKASLWAPLDQSQPHDSKVYSIPWLDLGPTQTLPLDLLFVQSSPP